MYNSIGFIGAGNMASAIIGGIVDAKFISPQNIYISNPSREKMSFLASKYGINICNDNIELVSKCDVVVLSVKPHIYKPVIEEIREYVKDDTLIITIAAGVRIDYVKVNFRKNLKIVRTMPNTPALVGDGMTAITYCPPAEREDVDFVKGMFSSFGLVEELDETLIDAFSSVGGSSPAFVDMFIEAMADAAVLLGLPRDKSYIIAAQAVRGAAKMIIETKKHPGELKDMVCSPSGTTIEGVRILENKGMRAAVIEAVIASAEKAKAMGDKYK